MSFIAELKRRNVIRMGMAYALIAWVLLQAADFGFDLVGAPDWVVRSLFVLALIGLPAALVFSWVFELTPDGIKLEKEVERTDSIGATTGRKMDRTIILFLGLAVVLLLGKQYWYDEHIPSTVGSNESGDKRQVANSESGTRVPETNDEAADSTASAIPSIAVLPFIDMSPEGDQGYFSDGIAEEILNVLVKTDRMKVAGRTSSFQFDGRSHDLREIGQTLGVEHILEGSVRKAGNRVRITAQLVKAQDGFHLWSETFDRELTDIFAVQDEIARAIASAMAVQLDSGSDGLVKVSTQNFEAYEYYLAARALIAARSEFARARMLVDLALELDPEFANAWSALAQILALSPYYSSENIGLTALSEAEEAGRRAVELDPQLSTAHSVLGDVYRDRDQWSLAIESYKRALALNPQDVEANQQLAQLYLRVGYFEEGLKYSSISVDLDPLSWVNLTVHASFLYLYGDIDGAWEMQARSRQASGVWRDFQALNGMFMAASESNTALLIEMTQAFARGRQASRFSDESMQQTLAFLDLLQDRELALDYLREIADPSRSFAQISDTWEVHLLWALQLGDLSLAEHVFAIRNTANFGAAWLYFSALEPLFESNPSLWFDFLESKRVVEFWQEYGYPSWCDEIDGKSKRCSGDNL